MPPIDHGPLGQHTAYPTRYDPAVLFAIPRAQGRDECGVDAAASPFVGHDRWQAYELGWLDARGKPQVGTATFWVPADSPFLIESKSFKLYLNSLNAHRIDDEQTLQALLQRDLSRVAGAPVTLQFGLPPMDDAATDVVDLDAQAIAIDHYGPPDPTLLAADADALVEETLVSALFKSNCPVTGQPDWADVRIDYRGGRIARDGLLRYLVGFREHRGFHEQCVETLFLALMARCRPQRLSVEARYTRRGGLDINPWRATPGMAPPPARRSLRQ